MPKHAMFYEFPTPVSEARHKTCSVKPITDYAFARSTNAVPLVFFEFAAAAPYYPIVFAENNGCAAPLAVLGLREENQYLVATDNSWSSNYVPAIVRRYPFIFVRDDPADVLTLCIDEGYDGFDKRGVQGERLFNEDGTRTAYLDNALAFVNSFEAEYQKTMKLGKQLLKLDIFEPMQAQLALGDGKEHVLTGFNCVSREKLKLLSPTASAELLGNDMLELIYLHLQSVRNFDALVQRQRLGNANLPTL
jgi:hypothetical protein